MTELVHQPCPIIGCDSSDAFSYNTEKMVGRCHSCEGSYPNRHVKDWAKDKYPVKETVSGADFKKKLEEEQEDDFWSNYEMSDGSVVEEVVEKYQPRGNLKVNNKVIRRGILPKTLDFYGIKVYYDEDDVAVKDEYPYPSGAVKTRYISDKGFSVKGSIDSLFGENLFPPSSSRMVTITEGELDAASAYQMLQGGGYINPVVSVPSATPSKRLWESCHKWLDSFEKIILSVDNDKAGNALAERISKMFLGKVYRVNHGDFKDANDFLVAGKGNEYKKAWWAAKQVKPDSILSNPDDYLDLFNNSPDFEYFPTGIKELDEKMLGICKGYITLIQAPTGLGKSEVMRYFEHQLLQNSDYKVASCRKEETKLRSLLGLVSYRLNDNLTLQMLVEEKGRVEEVKDAIRELSEDERFVTFSIDETQSNDETMQQLNFLIAGMGVDYIFIEPIQDIVSGANASEKEGKISDLITRMGNLCGDTGVGIVIIAHENNDGGAMYSRMITMKAGFKIVLKGNRDDEDPQERNRTYLEIRNKNRVGLGFGNAGALDFDIETYTLTPVSKVEPKVNRKDGDF